MAYQQSRRDFIKLATVSLSIPGSLGALGDVSFASEDKWIRSVCEMCSSRCSIEVRVVDGKPVWLQGNAFDKAIGTSLCARGLSGISQLFDKDRLVKPLIRTGKRGENQWREVEYDEAIAFIASKLQALKKNYGPQSVLFSSKTGESFDLLRAFALHFGSPNTFSHWSSCPIAIESAFEQTFGEKLHRDYERSTYILNFGHNLFEGLDISLSKAMARFAANPSKKLVVLDPRFSIMAAKADEWLPVKPGQDLAFVLALLHVWIRDGKFDRTFVEKYCVGFEALRNSLQETTPQWQERFTGIEAKTVEKIANEIYEAAPKCIIDWGHKTTTSPAEFQKTRAVIIANILMGNVEKEGGIYFAKTPERINMLTQEMTVPLLNNPYRAPKVAVSRIDRAGESGAYRFVPAKHGVLTAIPEAILSQTPYAIKGWFMTRHNPLITVADSQKMKEAMETLEFIVVNDVYLSDTAMMADVVLPEATYLERDEGIILEAYSTPAYAMRNRTMTPLYQTKSLYEIMHALAERLNMKDAYPWKTTAQLRAYQADGNEGLLTNLLKKGYVSFEIPPLFMRERSSVERFCERYAKASAFKDGQGHINIVLETLKTPSKKIELFCKNVEAMFEGYGTPGVVDMDVQKTYPYTLISGKSAVHTNGHTHNIPYLHMLMPENPLWMHPRTAKEHGLKTNDFCYIENEIAKEKVRVFVTEGIRPDTLFLYMGFGRQTPQMSRAHHRGANPSKVLSLQNAPVCGAMITNIGVRIVKV